MCIRDRYLAAAFGSALITSVYSIVDMAIVGQYQGPDGTAALAVVAPIWNIIFSLGLLMGIGGSIKMCIRDSPVTLFDYQLYAAKATDGQKRLDGKEGNILYALEKAI